MNPESLYQPTSCTCLSLAYTPHHLSWYDHRSLHLYAQNLFLAEQKEQQEKGETRYEPLYKRLDILHYVVLGLHFLQIAVTLVCLAPTYTYTDPP